MKWPKVNIGIVTGKISGLVVIDIDAKAGREAYFPGFGTLYNTIFETTGKEDALHLLLQYPKDGFYSNMVRAITDVGVRGGWWLYRSSSFSS